MILRFGGVNGCFKYSLYSYLRKSLMWRLSSFFPEVDRVALFSKKTLLLLSTKGSIDIGFSNENHHESSLIVGVVHFCGSLLHCLVEWIDPRLAKVSAILKVFWHQSYIAIMSG